MMYDLLKLHNKVSYHAVTRFVQRVLNIRISYNENLSPQEIAEIHSAHAGASIEHIRSLILTPPIAAASLLRLSHVGTKDFTARLNPANGTITTIIVVEPANRNKVPCALTIHRNRFRCRVAKRNQWSLEKSKRRQNNYTPKVETGVSRKIL